MGIRRKLRRRLPSIEQLKGPVMRGVFESTDEIWAAVKAWMLEARAEGIAVEACCVLIGEESADRVFAVLALRSELARVLLVSFPEARAPLDCSDPPDCMRVLSVADDGVDSLVQPAFGEAPAASKDGKGASERWETRLVEVR